MGLELLIGAVVSGIVELIKKYFGTTEYITLAIVAVLSILSAWGYSYLVEVGLWQSFYQILLVAGGIYVFIIKRFEK